MANNLEFNKFIRGPIHLWCLYP